MRLTNLICCLLLVCSGCSTGPRLNGSLSAEPLLTDLSAEQIFAIHPDGDRVAFVRNGLELLRLSDGYRQRLLFDPPDVLIWSADGRELVVAVRETEQTRLVKLTANQAMRAEVFVDEQITDFAWLDDGRLLAMAQAVEQDQGSVRVEALLLIWDGSWDVERVPLYSFTYRQPLAAESSFPDQVVHRFDLSPLKDELIYNRYLDSPAAGGRVEQVLYHLQTGRERILAENNNRQLEALLTADGEHVLLPQLDEVIYLNPWTNQVKYHWPGPGQSLQLAPGRNLFLIDGQLLAGEQPLLTLPADAKAQFSEDGSRLFVATGQKLYLFAGYAIPEKIHYSAVEKVKLQNLRQQRSRNEIGNREYSQARNNILHP